MATDKEGWGAGKCPQCKSYNTDSNVGGAEGGLASYDCLDCGHGWDQQPRKNAAQSSGLVNHRPRTDRAAGRVTGNGTQGQPGLTSL